MDSADLLSAIVADGYVAVSLSRLSEASEAMSRQIRDAGRDLAKRGIIASTSQAIGFRFY